MKKNYLALLAAGFATAVSANAQSAVDALQLTQSDFKGTARFMSMGGAFTALGGDLSAIGQNPGGIGVYRHSELGVTLDIDIKKRLENSVRSKPPTSKPKYSATILVLLYQYQVFQLILA